MAIFVLCFLSALASSVYLVYLALKRKLRTNIRALYLIIAAMEFYSGIVYFLILLNVLPIVGYGAYIRPVVPLLFLSLAFVAAAHVGEK